MPPQRGILIIVLFYILSHHVLKAYPVPSFPSQRLHDNSYVYEKPPLEKLRMYEAPYHHEKSYSMEDEPISHSDRRDNLAVPAMTASIRHDYPRMRHFAASRHLHGPESYNYASSYPSPESGTEVISVRPLSKFPVSENDPLSNLYTGSDSNMESGRSAGGSNGDHDNGRAVMDVQLSERSDSWTPKEQDTIVSGWMHTLGSLFGYKSQNSTAKPTPVPSPSMSPSTKLSSVRELDNLEQNLDRLYRSSPSILRSNGDTRVSTGRSVNRKLIRHRRPHPISRDELPSAEYWDPPFSSRFNSEQARQRQKRFNAPSQLARYRDVRDSRDILTSPNAIRRDSNPREYLITRRLPVEPTSNDADASVPQEYEDSEMPIGDQKYSSRGDAFPNSDISNDVNVGEFERQGEYMNSLRGDPTNDPLSRTEAIEMVRLFRRLFETLDVTLDGHDGLTDSYRKELSPTDMHTTLVDVKKLKRMREHGLHDESDEISDQDRPDDTAVARAIASAARAAAKAESAESSSLDIESQVNSVDKPADIEDPIADVPPSAPAYGSRKKLLEAKSKGALGDLYDSITSAIKSIL